MAWKEPFHRCPIWLQKGLVRRDFLSPGQFDSRKAILHQKANKFLLFCGPFSILRDLLELQWAPKPLNPPWNEFWTRHCGHIRSAVDPCGFEHYVFVSGENWDRVGRTETRRLNSPQIAIFILNTSYRKCITKTSEIFWHIKRILH